jgi:hypothetical protein
VSTLQLPAAASVQNKHYSINRLFFERDVIDTSDRWFNITCARSSAHLCRYRNRIEMFPAPETVDDDIDDKRSPWSDCRRLEVLPMLLLLLLLRQLPTSICDNATQPHRGMLSSDLLKGN